VRLLCIANPSAYAATRTDVPEGYARLAAHPAIELFHVDTGAVLAGGSPLPVVAIPRSFQAADFRDLPGRSTTPMAASAFDLVFCRTLKPFPGGYLDRLVALSRHVAFLNDPTGIRRQLEPRFALEAAASHMPETLLTGDPARAEAFLERHGRIVLKQPNSCGGRGVLRVERARQGGLASDHAIEGPRSWPDVAALFARLGAEDGRPLLVSRYLPRVVEGEKRIVAVEGEPYGAYLKRSPRGHWVQNVSQGALCEPTELDAADRAMVEATQPPYGRAGIRLLGYDLIRDDDGRWLVSEINAGNVGGLFRLEALGEPGVGDRFVAFLEARARRAAADQGAESRQGAVVAKRAR
jgi:glutathione synthase